jgi:hypothetical protein
LAALWKWLDEESLVDGWASQVTCLRCLDKGQRNHADTRHDADG